MDYFVWGSALLVIVSKFFDCLTTDKYIKSPYGEKNPIARKLMLKFGIRFVIWIIFLFTIFLTGITVWFLYLFYDSFAYKAAFVIIALFVSAVQFAVVHTNYYGRINFITKILLKIY